MLRARVTVNAGIKKLQLIAYDGLAHILAKAEFNEHVVSRKNYHMKGAGPQAKKELFDAWFAARLKKPKTSGLIYAFWGQQHKCIYIGRTGSHGSRPSVHFEKYWFSGVKRITIFSIKKAPPHSETGNV